MKECSSVDIQLRNIFSFCFLKIMIMKTRKSKWGNMIGCSKIFPLFIFLCLFTYFFEVTSLSPTILDESYLIGSNNNRTLRSTASSPRRRAEVLKYTYRLFDNVVPEKYFLTITPILENGFEDSLGKKWEAPGSVLISARVVKPTKSITLHSKNITVHNVTITNNAKNIPVQNISFYEKHSYLTIHLFTPLEPGETLDIDIKFTAYVSETLNGLFRSSYTNEETGEVEWFAATHMEALHARQMFICFDEPRFKATIQAKVGRQQNYTALFNTESIKNETMDGVSGWVWETFAPTVPMSTYLTALIVAKFDYSEAPGNLLPELKIRTYAPPHFIKKGAAKYAANTAEVVLHTYENYFGEKYPLQKLDNVAVPSFQYGGMENFGLVIFRETLLLHFANYSTESQRYIVTNVICHELGHQWFGNLVSPNWWTHLWLSEGLTKFTEYIGLNATVPEFQPWDIFVSESLQMGLRLDGDQRTSHSLKIDEDAWLMKSEMEWFDDIAYKKGGSLVRMMQGFLTEPVLRKGLGRYLSRLKYKAAVQDDLFMDCNIEAELAHKLPQNTTLKEVMADWTLKSGFPLLKVEHVPGTNNVRVFQEKYVASHSNRKMAKPRGAWFIPVSVATTKNPNFDPEAEFWIRKNESSVALTLPSNSWIILNAGTTGFYRVLYDDELTNRITDQLNALPTAIDRLARSQLIDDYFNAAWNRYIPIRQALNLTKYLNVHAETENVVWTALFSMLKGTFRLFNEQPEDFEIFKGYFLPRIEKAINSVGGFDAITENSTGMPVIRHAQLLDWACSLGSQGCIDYSTNLVKAWNSTGYLKAPKDFRVVVLNTAVSNDSTEEMTDFLLEKYKSIQNSKDMPDIKLKEQILAALASTRNLNKIKTFLDIIFQSFDMPSEDAVTLLQHLSMNVAASDTILNYLNDNYETIVDRFSDISVITATTNAMAPHLKSLSGLFLVEKLSKINEGLHKHEFVPTINRIRANIIWYDEFGEEMLQFFQENQ